MEYSFTDTGAELPETLDFIERMKHDLRRTIVGINAGRGLDY